MSIVLITGASRGIGAHLARQLAVQGHTVYAGMRQPDADIPGTNGSRGEIRPIRMDVTRDSDIRAAMETIVEQSGGLDVLINNAGVAWFAAAEEMSPRVLRETMETNFFGAVSCTRAALPIMRTAGSGAVIMISSLAAAVGLPLESAYCASKSALNAFAESLRFEVAPFGVRVAVIEPGITAGGLSTSIPDPDAPDKSAYQALLHHTFGFYDAAQADVESPELIVAAVADVLSSHTPSFRYRLGQLAPQIDAILKSEPGEATNMLASALDINWWLNNAPAGLGQGRGR